MPVAYFMAGHLASVGGELPSLNALGFFVERACFGEVRRGTMNNWLKLENAIHEAVNMAHMLAATVNDLNEGKEEAIAFGVYKLQDMVRQTRANLRPTPRRDPSDPDRAGRGCNARRRRAKPEDSQPALNDPGLLPRWRQRGGGAGLAARLETSV
jgi:hypothetical protein